MGYSLEVSAATTLGNIWIWCRTPLRLALYSKKARKRGTGSKDITLCSSRRKEEEEEEQQQQQQHSDTHILTCTVLVHLVRDVY
jgi:hypothetical protein